MLFFLFLYKGMQMPRINAQSAGVAARLACAALLWSSAANAQTLSGPECLRRAYPEFWAPDTEALVSRSGQRFEFDEHKDHLQRTDLLNQADLKSQMAQPYTPGFAGPPPLRDHDPGRLRAQLFFTAMYGTTPAEVQRHLVPVPWAPSGGTLPFTRLNGAAEALERVGRVLAQEARTAAYVRRPAGSVLWRRIAGTPRLSAHAFGAAVDFTLPKGLGRYWQWSGCTETGACPYPVAVRQDPTLQRVVAAFEQEGFIWGGQWAHFDTVHFEYRPELVGPACSR